MPLMFTDRLYPLESLTALCCRVGMLFLSLASCCLSHAQGQEHKNAHHRVLVIHSYHEGLRWTDGENRGIKATLLDRENTSLSIEYLDSKRFPYEEVADTFATYLSQKYAYTPPFDAVIVSDNNALSFVSAYRKLLFQDVPVVFCGINDFHSSMLTPFNGQATGVMQTLDPLGTIELMKRLQPELETLFVISGTTPTAEAIRHTVEKALEGQDVGLHVRYLSGLSTDDLLSQLAELTSRDAVLMCNFNRDADGRYYSHEESAHMITKASRAPVYAMEDNNLGTGIAGGYMNSAFAQGRFAGKFCKEILDTGKVPQDIASSPNSMLFDYDALLKYGLDHRRLPEAASVLHLPKSFYQQNRILIWNLLIAFGLLSLGLIGTTFGYIRSRRAEKRLRDKVEENFLVNQQLKSSEGQMRALVQTIPDLVWLKDPDGVYLACNQLFENLYGTPQSEIIGKTDHDFIDKELADFFRANDLAAIEAGGPRVNEEMVTFVSDGHQELLETIKTPMFDEDGKLLGVLGIGRDITERKQIESKLKKKVVTLTRPTSEMDSITFDDLFDLSIIQKLQDQFSMATGVASIITCPDGTPITRPSNFCTLCSMIRETRIGCQNCYKSDAIIGRIAPGGPSIQTCESGGLWDAGAGIAVGGKHIANWLIGQVRDNTQSEATIRDYACKIGLDEDKAARAFHEVPAMPREQFDQVAEVLYTIASQLSDIAYQNIQQARHITERQQAEDALRTSEENLRTTLNSIADAVISTDIDGKVTRMNLIAQKLTGWSIQEALGKPLAEVFRIIDPHNKEPLADPAKKVLESGDAFEAGSDTVLVSKDGSEHRISNSASAIRTDSGEVTGLVLVFRDVTEEMLLQEQLRQSQKMDAIGHLAGGIAHDFNNMINGIIGGTALLEKRNPFDEKSKRLVRLIQDSAERAAGLTSKLLSFARRQPSASTTVDIHSILEDTIAILRQTIDKRIDISRELKSSASSVVGDDAQLESVFLNIGINASHAMADGGSLCYATRHVIVSEEECRSSTFDMEPGDHIEITIEDTGHGIAPEHLPRIFEPFFTTKELGRGTGLGLAAAHGTVTQHHGSITASSEPGQGTTFRILLPLSSRGNPTLKGQDESTRGAGHILLVDDESAMRITGSGLLEDLGYTVETAENGAFGLEVFRENPGRFDLVLLDMIMPIMSGKKCFAEMKKLDPDVRIVLSSGFTREEDLEEMKKNGLCGFIKKPFNEHQLSKIVFEAIHSRIPGSQ